MKNDIAGMRREYAAETLSENDVAADPILQFEQWWRQAIDSNILEPNAMTLATASCDGVPSARIVLLKGVHQDGFVFYTNYKSYKGLQLEENPKASLVFFWKELERQVRIVGLVKKVPPAESDAYFKSRPKGSQVGAIASPQSTVIESRNWLDSRYSLLANELDNTEIKRPDWWGGYIVSPVLIEFWQGRSSRLHDRLQYTLQQHSSWKIERLAP
jgi:pyridoxamine 5'-phosphate oxidase